MSEVQLTYSKLVQIARGLAIGCLEGKWDVDVRVVTAQDYIAKQIGFDGYTPEYRSSNLGDAVVGAFLTEESAAINLEVGRVLKMLHANGYAEEGILTFRSFDLTQSTPDISIFISYRRVESSLLALYLQSRFRIAGGEAFVDVNNLTLGDDWHPALEERVKTSAYFVCLVGSSTLKSEYVRQEIEWALEASVTIIPVLHNGFDAGSPVNKLLVEKHPFLKAVTQKHGHVIKDAGDPNDYRNAVDEILTSLGYAVL